jgi:DNA-binding CsgD family transcriptional regulator
MALRHEVVARLRGIVNIDAAFFATVDPATMLFTSALSEDPLIDAAPLFLANELDGHDVNRFIDLAADPSPIRALDHSTAGRRLDSERYATILRPLGLGDELRVALRTRQTCWGVMCLHREDGPAGFDERDAAMVAKLAPHIAEGLRRALLPHDVAPAAHDAAHGIVIVDDDGHVESMNDAAEHWLAAIPDTDWLTGELPVPVQSVASAVSGDNDDTRSWEPTVRLRTADGTWISVHASRLRGPTGNHTVVVIEPAEPAAIVSVVLDSYGVTGAQARVVALVLRGYSTQQIVNDLHISAHTVQEHLKAVFDKLGVRSRRELAAALLHPSG